MEVMSNVVEDERSSIFFTHTSTIFSLYKLLASPLEGLFYILSFILYKELNASPLQLTILISTKPAVALLSFYGNLFIKNRPSNLRSMIILCTLLGAIPCAFIPWCMNVWFIIFAHALFMISLRAVLPAWSEILKINLATKYRGRVFSIGSMTNYTMIMAIPLLISPFLDRVPFSWVWFFFAFSLLNCLNIFLLLRLQLKPHTAENDSLPQYQFDSFSSIILDPWKNGFKLLKERPDFRKFQVVFMLAGGGLMVMQPVLPIFCKDILQFSYLDLTLAYSFCKGISFVLSSPTWGRKFGEIPIHLFNTYVTAFAVLFAAFLLESENLGAAIYLAYLMYGTMQAGSELSWNLSGPLFAKNQDSTLFSGINVATVGIRGCVAPFLGDLIFSLTGSFPLVFIVGGSMCLLASCYSLKLHFVYSKSAMEIPS